jgi:hypothetical protein
MLGYSGGSTGSVEEGSVKKVLLVAALAAAVLVPAASASRAPSVKLALLPLPKSALGSAAHSLALAHDSGPVSNAAAAVNTTDATTAAIKKLGRVNGYVLTYGDEFDGATGVTSVRTGVELYKSAADAKHGLAFWRKEDAELSALNQPGFAVANVLVKVPSVGTRRFAYLTSFSASNIAPVSVLDEQVADGRYVLDIAVAAGTGSAAKELASKLAKKLDARLKLALKGRLHAKPVKLPAKQTAGRPPGGPDLSAMALQTSDLAGTATLSEEDYFADPGAVSDYGVLMLPAGPFDLLDQEIEWFSTANEASFEADLVTALARSQQGTTVLDLSSLGDGAQGSVAEGSSVSSGQVVFSTGKLAEFIFMGLQGAIGTNDVTSVAQAAANRLNAALGG